MFKEIEYNKENWIQCICDNCGVVAEDEEQGFNLMPDKVSSWNMAMELGWHTGKKQLCPNCINKEE